MRVQDSGFRKQAEGGGIYHGVTEHTEGEGMKPRMDADKRRLLVGWAEFHEAHAPWLFKNRQSFTAEDAKVRRGSKPLATIYSLLNHCEPL